MYRNGVPVLELKIRRFVSQSLHLGFTIWNHSSGETPDLGRDGEHVGDGFGVHEPVRDFFLGDDRAGVFAAEGDAGEA